MMKEEIKERVTDGANEENINKQQNHAKTKHVIAYTTSHCTHNLSLGDRKEKE